MRHVDAHRAVSADTALRARTREEQPWRWPTIELRGALLLLALFLAVAMTQAVAFSAVLQVRGVEAPLAAWLLAYFGGALGAWVAVPVIQTAILNATDPHRGGLRFLGMHLAGYAVFTALHTAVTIAVYQLGTAWLEIWRAPKTPISTQILDEMQADLILYPAIAGIWYAARAASVRREADLHAARLERALVETRLEALTARLDPHFLFNALNTLSAVMHRDLERADRLFASLGDILRVALGPGAPSWRFAEERAYTERYVELLVARFDDRVRVRWSVDPASARVQVPRFTVQSLVENAVKHNAERDALSVDIAVARRGDALELRVADDGCGFPAHERTPTPGRPPRGLARLEETLVLMHGERASLVRGQSAAGGAEVVVRLPAEEA